MKPLSPQVLALLVKARERVCSGWPSVALAMAGTPTSTAQARLREAEDARHASTPPPPWVQVLTDALAAVEEARDAWGAAPDVMPPAASDTPLCGMELRPILADARACAARSLAWEDPGGLSRPQAACVLHLAICQENWRMAEQRLAAAAEKARAELERERQASTQAAAQRIWGPQPKREPPPKEPSSLRDLAHYSSAFSDWGEDVGEENET